MSDNISPETQEKIESLCKQISVAHNLDEEIQRELRTHIEDKFSGYLNGDEKLTEEDAFILVREHFGNPAVIRELYRDVETAAVQVILARRLGAVLSASLVTQIVSPQRSETMVFYPETARVCGYDRVSLCLP